MPEVRLKLLWLAKLLGAVGHKADTAQDRTRVNQALNPQFVRV